jgi:uncharacterized membrane protein affecting hemolysin expression
MHHTHIVEPILQSESRLISPNKGEKSMEEGKSFDMGVAGSLTMIFLTLAMVVLLTSFYRRYKRLVDRKEQD